MAWKPAEGEMKSKPARDLLKQQVDVLTEEMAEEVLDFVLFVRARRHEDEYLWRQAEEARAYREQHPEDVFISTAEEWDKATARFEDESS
jgi:hypothetical protein